MAFIRFEEPEKRAAYNGIRVGVDAVNVSIFVHRLLKEKGITAIDLLYDKGAKAIRFVRNDSVTAQHKVRWCNPIGSRIHREMPTGRYHLDSHTKDSLTFKLADPT